MKPIIGIIYRNSISDTGKDIKIIYQDMIYAVRESGGIPVGVSANNILDYFDICNGFILQGGDDIDDEVLNAIKKIKDKNIPLLGICLGMQEMSLVCGGNICDIDNHKGDNLIHEIEIDKNSLLYKIIGTNKIMVNSRHKSAVFSPKIKVSSISDDYIIESVEDDKDKLFLGVQWHPENLYNTCIFARKIFDYFIEICND